MMHEIIGRRLDGSTIIYELKHDKHIVKAKKTALDMWKHGDYSDVSVYALVNEGGKVLVMQYNIHGLQFGKS